MRPGFSTGDPEMAHPPPHPRESLVGSQPSCGKSRHGLGNEPRAMGNGKIHARGDHGGLPEEVTLEKALKGIGGL